MTEDHNHNFQPADEFGNVRNSAENFRIVPNASAAVGSVPNSSEPFRTVPNDAESFGTFRKIAERKENHTLTVRDVARMFEAAGVARTERSILNWCQPNRTGIARLDSYFDPNERKYYISPQSAELAIAEEKAKAAKNNDAEMFGTVPQNTETFRTIPNRPETTGRSFPNDAESREVKELEFKIRDLEINNRAKDMMIEGMQKERDKFIEQMMSANRKVGELETKLLQLEPPDDTQDAMRHISQP